MVGFELMEGTGNSASASLPNRSIISAGWKANWRAPSCPSAPCRRPGSIWPSPSPRSSSAREQKPTASVLVTTYPGRVLDAAQVVGITHLVAASVPQLPPTSPS